MRPPVATAGGITSSRRTPCDAVVDGAHHITFLTEDMDRLLAF